MKLVRTFQFRLELFHVLPLVNVLFLALLLFALSARFTLQPGLSLSLPASPFTLILPEPSNFGDAKVTLVSET